MSHSYLQKFRSALPTAQGNQILRLLITKKDKGEIRTVDEFKDRLKELTAELLAERITPTLKLYKAIGGEDISSEEYNDMLDRIKDDLEAGFVEADNIDEIIAAHHNVINSVALKALRFGINELESKISLYEFLNRSGKGFDDALFNTFRESQNLKTPRAASAASLVYVDPRTNQIITSDEDAQLDFIGERLILGAEDLKMLPVQEATWLANSNSIRSELDVSFPDSRVSNIVDGKNNSYWVIPILLQNIRREGVPMELNMRLSAAQDVNFVELEPACNYPMVLAGVDYMDANNVRQSLAVSEILLKAPTRINFKRITATSVILKFRQDNYDEIQFKQKPGESNFHKAVLGESQDSVDLESVSTDLKDILSSDFILSDVMGVDTPFEPERKFYEYILGFDNIRLGFNTFQERSIYVSAKKEVAYPGQFGLRVVEQRPLQNAASSEIELVDFNYPVRSDANDLFFHHGTIEYWLTCQLYSEDDFLIDTLTVPILPLGASRVYHERVIFTKKSTATVPNPDMGSMIFFTEADATDVLVYRNGTLLRYGHTAAFDWEFVPQQTYDTDYHGDTLTTEGDTDITFTIPGAGQAMQRGIRIWGTVRPLDVYTISYTPKVSNTYVIPLSGSSLLDIVDLTGDKVVRMVQDNAVIFESFKKAYKIAKANTYLTVLMRRNSANLNFSPILEEYMLVTGSKNLDKFVSE
ncbi:MAG: hypothetical protein DRI46_12630 [Chloroflexi bacterium]|nr:MAG: hypothetical protein DRI46_12630 [Chloroflexota bacterium]